MKNTIQSTLTILTIGFAVAANADQPASYAGASLGDLMTEVAEFQVEKERLGEAVTAKIVEVLPKSPQAYGEFEWRTVFAGDFIAANAMDEEKKQLAAVQIHYHPSVDDKFRKRYSEECHGFPAKRYNDKWVWVLVGRTEIRLSVMDKSMQSDATLDSIIESFDLKKIEAL